ncbi:hypothetical protein dsat_0565 [Alkalidesulfovibrio alkalitolerans DSM 16529]|uniref:Uncharacterized protein n=1 Tax=Alkalidesulfovibrio alkalitolerans DSM 16529 TaxID=1121439 RepID=S7UH14_9BACT|nr:hypothetical protein dsat_0565 [Alkalidesulfovibrio alkalitolerans DSM 16529]
MPRPEKHNEQPLAMHLVAGRLPRLASRPESASHAPRSGPNFTRPKADHLWAPRRFLCRKYVGTASDPIRNHLKSCTPCTACTGSQGGAGRQDLSMFSEWLWGEKPVCFHKWGSGGGGSNPLIPTSNFAELGRPPGRPFCFCIAQLHYIRPRASSVPTTSCLFSWGLLFGDLRLDPKRSVADHAMRAGGMKLPGCPAQFPKLAP